MTEHDHHDHHDHAGHDHGHDHGGHDHGHAHEGGQTMTVTVAEGATLAVDDVTEAMKDVVDPELGINVVDLGLVYGVHIGESSDVVIDMTLTSAACPLTYLMQEQTNMALEGMVNDVAINWVWMPPWGPDKITPDGREQLRALGFNV